MNTASAQQVEASKYQASTTKSISGRVHHLNTVEATADSLAKAYIKAGHAPGLTIAIAHKGETVFVRGYGIADVEMGVAAGPETVYKIGSITKQFTAATIMRLVEAGKISLQDSITQYLPAYPAQGHHITIHHLLNHTSGIKGYRALAEENRQRFRQDLTYDEMVELFGKQPLDFKPGEKYAYNNTAYYLLAEIISRVTGTPWADYVERELLQPLGLTKTVYCNEARIIPNRAEGYEFEKNKLQNARYLSMQIGSGAGALCATAGELVRWSYLLHTGKVVSPKALAQMTTPTVLMSGDTVGYGYGLQLDELNGHWQVFHGGGANGFVTALAHYPDSDLSVAVLTNSGKGNPGQIVKALAREALGVQVHDLPLTPQAIARYAGTYTYQLKQGTRELLVFGENGQLKAQFVGGRPFRLLYQGNHAFIPSIDEDERLVFRTRNNLAESIKHQEGRWDVTIALRKPGNPDQTTSQEVKATN
ncbi:serine hydrolase domain-containing protein [Telluribacter humicola]|uniref:serine hydrolase domain-containing protein n=1 Tax=Telluribacter humicola TaxID=1720261 RepID=UPI001A9672B9|nr:serine hydrolase domain-containing protein [Telluribacter humicola]